VGWGVLHLGERKKEGEKEDKEWRNASEAKKGEREGEKRHGRQKMHPAKAIIL